MRQPRPVGLIEEAGATLAEYAFVLMLVAIVSLAVVTALGLVITDFYTDIVPGFA